MSSISAATLNTQATTTLPLMNAAALLHPSQANSNHMNNQQQALQQLMATQSLFSTLSPDQRILAQQLAAESIQMNFLQDKSVQVGLI